MIMSLDKHKLKSINLLGMSKNQVIDTLGGLAFNDINSDVWFYRVPHRYFWSKKFLFLFFKDDKVINVSFLRSKKIMN
ncbi:hypothetical protein GCM10009431_08150 [Gaetbulibacter jejuensis]|uniref:SmpA / OmlA family protein n=1 Tax=Gaetbulibacter jejuensis TaxID=584607 RepID=A0ABP3UN88_9FLAO